MGKCKQCGTPTVEGISNYCPSCGQEKLEKARERIRAGKAKKRSTYPSGQTPEEPKTPKKSNPILEAARKYLAKSYSVIPIKKGEKYPVIKWDVYQDKLPTESELCKWFENTDNQIGIITGNVSGGLFILDFDGDDWEKVFFEFLERFKEFADSLIVRTGSGKAHIYGVCPEMSRELTRRVKKYVKDGKTTAVIELRANDSQTLCPPSLHPCGKQYTRIDETKEPVLIHLPRLSDILDLVDEVEPTEAKDDGNPPEGWQESIFQGVCEGERNTTLVKETGRLLGKKLSRSEILPVLLEANSKFSPPLDDHEVEIILNSMIKTDEKNKPREIKKADDYKFISKKELKTMEETEVQWFWDGVLPAGGLSLLLAKPKVGKTLFALNLALWASRGGSFFGKDTAPGNVIYLALEENIGEVKKSLIAFDNTHGEDDKFDLDFHFGIAPSDAIKKLEKWMVEKKPKLVVIDILQKFVRVKKIEDYAEVITALEPVMDIARRLDCHILLTHHAPKAERELIDSALGTTGLAASVDTIILIKKDGRGRRSFSTSQRYRKPGVEDIKDWVINLNKDEITLELAGTTSEVNDSDAKEQILKLMEEIGEGRFYTEPMTESQIRDVIKKDKAHTLRYLKELYGDKKIRREGTGHRNDPFKYSGEPKEMWRRSKKGQADQVDYTPEVEV